MRCSQPLPTVCLINEPIHVTDNGDYNITVTNTRDSIHRFEINSPSVLKIFPSVIFEKFPHLMRAVLEDAGIEVLTPTAFLNARNLKVLNLKLNKLKFIRNSTFVHAPSLRKVDLSQNEISEIEDGAFMQLLGLSSLVLNGNKLETLKRMTFSGLDNLRRLDLSFNQLETVDEDVFAHMNYLTELSLNDNNLAVLPEKLFTQTFKLDVIDLSNNKLRNIGNVFDECSELFFLNLTNNHELQDLELTKFLRLPSLRKLALDNTGFIFPDEPPATKQVHEPSKLIKLSLGSNRLSNVDIFRHLTIFPALRGLYLQNNDFTHFNDDIFDLFNTKLHEFRILDLKYNRNSSILDWLKANEQNFKNFDIEIEI